MYPFIPPCMLFNQIYSFFVKGYEFFSTHLLSCPSFVNTVNSPRPTNTGTNDTLRQKNMLETMPLIIMTTPWTIPSMTNL